MPKNYLTALDLNRIEGYIDREEGDRLARYAGAVLRGGLIVEIGSASGAGACYLAAGARRGQRGAAVLCVDPYETDEHEVEHYRDPLALELFRARANYLGIPFRVFSGEGLPPLAPDSITVHKARSLDVAQRWRDIGLDSIDLLHIDGMHDFENEAADFRAWIEFVRPGGVVIIHDIYNRKAYPDVLPVIKQVVIPSGLVREVERPAWSRYRGRRRGQWIGVRV